MPTYSDPTDTQTASKAAIIQSKGGLTLSAMLMLIAGFVGVATAGFFYWQVVSTQSKVATMQKKVATQQVEFNELRPLSEEVDAYAKIATNLHTLFDGQKRWKQVLEALEDRLYRKMLITTIQLNETGAVSLSATTPTYTDYAKIYGSLTDGTGQKYFSGVKPVSIAKIDPQATIPGASTSAVSSGAEVVSFTFTMNLLPPVLLPTTSQP